MPPTWSRMSSSPWFRSCPPSATSRAEVSGPGLRTLTYNRWCDFHRRRAAQPRVNSSVTLSALADPQTLDPFWEQEYRQHLVGRALELIQGKFRPATWKACWECVVGDRPAAEVAQELGLSVAAVYAAKSRVLRCLREELSGLLD